MHPLVEQHRAEIVALCRQHHARSLALFGSAATGSFDPARSDLDFLVEFEEAEPAAYSAAYFGLLEGLSDLFGRTIDLVVESAIENPYFRESVERTRTPLYAARGPEVPVRRAPGVRADSRVHVRADFRRLLAEPDAAVERQFQIIGEALNRLLRLEPGLSERITDGRRIIAFRNILLHAYAQIDNRVVWGVIESELKTLETDVAALLDA
ncbi:MAG: DUF86 domain-containing protein [Planctomycetota bacterium]|nr:DUF86 domain-containing protein [Planctomycetota bacterium]MDA1223492.1 DUF86 domain-containing protein [Planctomycetota bacterium]